MKLTNVVNRINGNVDRFTTELEYYVGGEHFDSEALSITRKGLIKPNLNILGFKFHFAFQKGDVLFMARNPHLRKAGMVMFSGLCSDASYILRTKNESILSQHYLAVLLQTDHFWDYCESHKVGSVNFAINWTTLANYEFELPPISQQRVLADKLWAAYNLKEAYKKMNSAIDEMVKSQFIEMIKNTTSQRKKIHEIAKVQTGSTPSKNRQEYWYNGNHPWVSAQDMIDKYVEDTIEKVTNAGYATCKVIPAGSVLYVCRGSIGVISINKMDCATNQSICTATCLNNCRNEFLYYSLKYSEKDIKQQGTGTSFKSLNQSSFSSIEIDVPSLDKQNTFIEIAQQADKSKFELKQAIDKIEKVMKSLLQ